MTAAELAALLNAELRGDGARDVGRPCHPDDARVPEDIAVATDKALLASLTDSVARIAVVAADAVDLVPAGAVDAVIAVGRPPMAMAALTTAFARPAPVAPGIHPSAVIEDGVSLGESVAIGPFVHIAAGAVIGDGCAICSHVSVGAEARIGPGCLLHAGVRIGAGCTLGAHVIVHNNACIGADGFSFVTPERGSVESAKDSGRVEATNTGLVRVHSLAAVTVGDHVEIGANACLDRGTLRDTVIGDHTKIDDLVLIGHNVRVGSHCMLCGRVGIAGSAVVGDRVVLAGGVGVADHVSIGDDAVVAAGSGVGSNLKGRQVYAGYPAIERDRAFEAVMLTYRLKSLFKDVRALKAAHRRGSTGGGDTGAEGIPQRTAARDG